MKRISDYLVIITFLCGILIISCDIKVDPFAGEGASGDTIIRGIVVDKADSTPLDSVLFTLSYSALMQNSSDMDLSPKTGKKGKFFFKVDCFENYCYRLGVFKEGYTQNMGVTYPFSIEKGEDNHFYIELEKKAE